MAGAREHFSESVSSRRGELPAGRDFVSNKYQYKLKDELPSDDVNVPEP